MKAIRYHKVGGPEVLRLDDVPEPTPGPGEVRIRVKAAGVNFADTERRRGLYDAKSPLPRILGSEAAGVVLDSVGASTWESSLESLAPFGHLVAYGSASGHPPLVNVEALYARSLKISAYWLRTPHPPALQRQAREALGQALGKGQLRVTLGLVVGLGEAVRAHQQLESRATVGKVVLRVP